MIEQLLSPGSWGSPLGLGVFMICLGLSVFLMTRYKSYWDNDEFNKMFKEHMKDSEFSSKKRKK